MQTKTVLAYYANYTISILCKIYLICLNSSSVWRSSRSINASTNLSFNPGGRKNKQTKMGVGNLASAYKEIKLEKERKNK